MCDLYLVPVCTLGALRADYNSWILTLSVLCRGVMGKSHSRKGITDSISGSHSYRDHLLDIWKPIELSLPNVLQGF